ncbi:MAG: hypothetical protein KBF68_08250 [Nitrosomonas sp.]|jgi:adenine-specific DNA-methyltransferase|nr:hypothetical protein [Nitrosomonas sp.]MBP9101346.1 hypothetical protein [Nitrosomonas sp.]
MADNESEQKPQQETLIDDEFSLQSQQAAPGAAMTKKEPAAKQPSGQRKDQNQVAEVLSYRHDDKRTNNPHVGMVDTHSDGVEGKTLWRYDPHIDPALQFDSQRATIENLIDDALASGDKDHMQATLEQLKRMQTPYLNWAGKAERTSFNVDTVSLHVHKRIDPATILVAVQKKLKDAKGKPSSAIRSDLLHAPFENLPSSRSSTNATSRTRSDEDLTQGPKMIKVFRDTRKQSAYCNCFVQYINCEVW